jgi:hypothetical protein
VLTLLVRLLLLLELPLGWLLLEELQQVPLLRLLQRVV